MVRHMDFMIVDDIDVKIKFRFYPRSSHMHSFDEEEPPKSLKDVYKVYYSWGILVSKNYSFDENNQDWTTWDRVFYMRCDECSVLEILPKIIRNIIDNKQARRKVLAFGQPGSDWEIQYIENGEDEEYYIVNVFNNFTDKGFRFIVDIDKFKDFAEYIDGINQYMLEHGEPI